MDDDLFFTMPRIPIERAPLPIDVSGRSREEIIRLAEDSPYNSLIVDEKTIGKLFRKDFDTLRLTADNYPLKSGYEIGFIKAIPIYIKDENGIR